MNRVNMKSLSPLRLLALVASVLLAACATPPESSSGGRPGVGNASSPTEAQLPQTKLPAPGQVPSVRITGRTAQAVLDDIVKFRTGKGMNVRNRSAMRVEFAEVVTTAKQPTEARMVYMLSPASGGLNLSARVFQVSYPGTAKERVAEITGVVSDKLGKELAGYAGSGGW